MAKRFENEVILTLRVSNDTSKRAAIRKVSDKMTVISAYLSTGKNAQGEYNPPINFDINVFNANTKNPTKMINAIEPNSGDYITVKGSLGSTGYTGSDGQKRTSIVIFAREISGLKEDKDTTSDSESDIWNE